MSSNLEKYVTDTYYQTYECIEKVLENPYRNVFTFDIKQSNIECVLLPEYCDLVLKLSMVNTDNTPVKTKNVAAVAGAGGITKDSSCVPENSILYTFFKNIRVFLNNVLISDSFDLFHHKAYINLLLSSSNSVKKSLAQTVGYYREDYSKTNVDENPAVIAKIERTANGKEFIVRGRLFNDLFIQNTPIISSDILMKFYRNDDNIMCHGTSKIKLHDIKIEAVCANLSPEKAIDLNKSLLSNSYKYQTCEIEMNSIELKDDFDHSVFKQITSGSLPHYIVICFLKTTTLRGDYDQYPFKYEDPGIKDIYLTNYNKKYPLGKGYSFHPTNKDYTSAYKNLFDQTKLHSIDFTLAEYPIGFFLLAFDLTTPFNFGEHEEKTSFQTQELQLYISMHRPITGYSCLIYMSRSKEISVNSLKQCIVSY